MSSHVEQYGYAVIRGFLDADEVTAVRAAVAQVYAQGMCHHASYRDHNLLFEVLNDPGAGERVVLQSYWHAWINTVLEGARRHPRYLEVLEPLIGRDIKQIANQIHWKHPGGKYTFYRFHQDLRFRERRDLFTDDLENSYMTTGLAIEYQDDLNGTLRVYPGSHKLGYLGLGEQARNVMGEHSTAEELRAAGLDPDGSIPIELEPGDLVIWTLLTVHGSGANTSTRNRPFLLNSYVRAESSPYRGEWAFKDGVSTALGNTPEICRYEQLHENPGPFYIEDDWTRQ